MITAVYMVESRLPIEDVAMRVANEQSAGITDNDRLQLTDLAVERGSSTVVGVVPLGPVERELPTPSSYPNGIPQGNPLRGLVTIEYPDVDTESGIEAILNVALGEAQNLGVVSGLKLIDIDFGLPSGVFEGPLHGVGTFRRRLRVPSRPILCAPIKPSTGLQMDDHIDRAFLAASGGADIVKDDELCLDTSYNPLGHRVSAMRKRLAGVTTSTGAEPLYVANLIGARRELARRLDVVVAAGAEAVMVAPSLMGFDVVEEVRSHSPKLLIFAHSTFTLAFSRIPSFGMGLPLWARIQRMLGADSVLLPTHGGSFGVSARESAEAVAGCLLDIGINPSMPSHSGSMNAINLPKVHRLSRSSDFIFTSGAGLFDHPDGVEVGAAKLLKALEMLDQIDVEWLQRWECKDEP